MALLPSILLALLFAGVQAQCPASFSYVGGRCLWFMTGVEETIAEATATCQFFGAELAKVDDCRVLGEIAAHIEDNDFRDAFWIGATDVVEEGTFLWNDGTPVQMGAPFWGPANTYGDLEPDSFDGCVAMVPEDGFFFHNEDCSELYTPICQHEGSYFGSCPYPYIKIGQGCYEILYDRLTATWRDARLVCQASEGDLAILDNCTQMASVISYLTESNMDTNFWIGGSYTLSSFEWLDGSQMALGTPFWGRNQNSGLQPDGSYEENCVALNSDDRHYFEDLDCSLQLAPLCEAPVEGVTSQQNY